MSVDRDFLLVLGSAELGAGEPDLGAKLMRAFLEQLAAAETQPAQIIFISSAVFLTTEGTLVCDVLRQLAAAGTRVLSCGTCLAYYGRSERLVVGEPTNMKDTVAAIGSHAKVVRL